MSSIAATEPVRTWRDRYKVHPCADVFPMMAEAELEPLAVDIKTRGQQQPVVQWREKNGDLLIIDGRNRLEACARIDREPCIVEWQGDDPAAYVIAANIKRRHLTKEQQAELIVTTIEAAEAAKPIDRAKPARSFNTKAGKKGGSTKDPVLTRSVEEAQKVGISKRTVQNVRRKRQEPKTAEREVTPTTRTAPTKHTGSKAIPKSKTTTGTPLPTAAHEKTAAMIAEHLTEIPPKVWNDVVDRALALAKARPRERA